VELSEENLRKIVEGEPVGKYPPFLSGSYKDCDTYANKLAKKIANLKTIEAELLTDSYGSGFASYYELFITKKDKSYYFDKEYDEPIFR
jgi:hypothetical protein